MSLCFSKSLAKYTHIVATKIIDLCGAHLCYAILSVNVGLQYVFFICVFVPVQVEEGGKADSLEQPLLVGDEIIIINDVELTGYRQEAITLVKGSYKTLRLTIRRYRLFVHVCVCYDFCTGLKLRPKPSM